MTPDMRLRVRQKKCGKHAELIQAVRTLVESNKWQRRLGARWGVVRKSIDPSQAINVERGHKNQLQLKLERNPADLY